MTLNDSILELRKLHRNNDGSKTSFLEIQHAALMVAKAAQHEAFVAELKAINNPAEQQDTAFNYTLQKI